VVVLRTAAWFVFTVRMDESHDTIRNVHTTYAAALKNTTDPKNSVQKTICYNSTSNAPDDGRMHPKHVELRIYE